MSACSRNRPDNPRRPPAHRSVTLRHSNSPPPNASPNSLRRSRVPSSNAANPPSSLDSSADIRKEDSGESSNAERWFERSNNDVQANFASGADAEPPFFLKNSSSSETPPDAVDCGPHAQSSTRQPTAPYPRVLAPVEETQGSSSEDFRSVIDDLTVQNKKLKRKLERYEKLYDAHLQQEKLFEIRVHGLPAGKKRELEETLRKFALSLEAGPPTELSSAYAGSTPAALDPHATASSYTSTRFADSAYASNTASGQGSGQHSLAPTAAARDHGSRKAPKHATAASRNQDIHSYLHDIPSTLLPKQPVAMTEKAKKKLIVRRLEQIFAGKGAAVGGHQQPLQQEEVSQSAARADRLAIEATGQEAKAEGVREARIMPKREEKVKDMQAADHAKTVGKQRLGGGTSPEQRPTRPLDLDLHRAQVPQDNIQYIRHLGFSPADFDADEQVDDHGYIYLNVLTNMAQLHTINVTPEFVQKAIAEYSDKLALSRDGRKVRWRGGKDVTRTSSNGSPDETASPHSTRGLEGAGSTRSTAVRTKASDSSHVSPEKASRDSSSNKLAYVPLFFHKQDSADDDMTSDEHITSWSSPHQERVGGNSSGLASSGVRTGSSKRKHRDNGPIIFYNKMAFCTDLSGDPTPDAAQSQPTVHYKAIAADPVGAATSLRSDDLLSYTGKGALSNANLPADDQMDVDPDSSDGSVEPIRFSPKTFSATARGVCDPVNPDFEVSGLGGVQPSDHFRIEVQSRRKSNVVQTMPNASHFARNKAYPQRIREILGDRQASEGSSSPAIEEEVLSTNRHNLPASELPEPATLFTFSSYEDDSDEDMDDDSGAESDISGFEDDLHRAPSAVPQILQFPSASSSDGDDSDSNTTTDDGSVDLLAGARRADPFAVHEREREYDANMAERLADEIPAGSSAATAGGGSGFNSPASPNLGRDGKSPSGKRKQSGGIVPSLKRAKAADAEKGVPVAGAAKQ